MARTVTTGVAIGVSAKVMVETAIKVAIGATTRSAGQKSGDARRNKKDILGRTGNDFGKKGEIYAPREFTL